jgi:transposase
MLFVEGHAMFEVVNSKVCWRRRADNDGANGSTGFASFPDQPRSGALSKLSDEHCAQLMKWIDAEPLTSRALVNHMKTDYGVGISAGILRNELKRMWHVWKWRAT